MTSKNNCSENGSKNLHHHGDDYSDKYVNRFMRIQLFIIYGVVSNQFCHSSFLSFTLACIQAPSWSSSIAMSEFLRTQVKNIVTSEEGNR